MCSTNSPGVARFRAPPAGVATFRTSLASCRDRRGALNGGRLGEVLLAVDEIRGLLQGDHGARRYAIRAIGDCPHPPHASELLPFLTEGDAELRTEALPAAQAAARHALAVALGAAAGARGQLRRALILAIVEKIGDTAAIPPLLWAAEHFSSGESRRLEAIISGMGLKSIPAVIHLLRNVSAPSTRACRALSRLAMPAVAADHRGAHRR